MLRSLFVKMFCESAGVRPRHSAALILLLLLAQSFAQGIVAGDEAARAQSSPASTRPAAAAAREKLQILADEWIRDSGAPGVNLGFLFGDGSELSISAGLADTRNNVKLTPGGRMPAGSVGKTFFSALAMQLISEKKFLLDDKIEKFLKDEPWFGRLPNAHDITIRMLMNHTSGLVRYELNSQFLVDLRKDPFRVWTVADRLKYLLDAPAPFAAGASWDYSDTNYIVLGHVMERVAGVNCYQEIRARFLDKYKLNNTIAAESAELAGVVQGYAGENNEFGNSSEMLDGKKMILNPQFEWAGGGFITTAADLARWARPLYGAAVIPKYLQKEFYTFVPAPMLGRGVGYGLGVIHWDTEVGDAVGHSGFFPGYLTEVRWLKDSKIAIAVQVNTTDVKARRGLPGFIKNCMKLAVEKN